MIYIVNGAPGSGKTTFENICRKYMKYEMVDIYSTIDFVKEIARSCGWNGEKTPENRKFLSDLKRLLTEWDNVPYKKTIQFVDSVERVIREHGFEQMDYVIFIDCREPEEITKLKTALSAKTVLVRRESSEQIRVSNRSDGAVLKYDYDIIIDNNGSIEDLEEEVKKFLRIEGLAIKETSEL